MAGVRQPVLTRRDVRDVDAAFVADPFLFTWEGRWHLFFEVFDWATGLGVIAVASSGDGRAWRYDGVAIREPHHLSYPHPVTIDGVPHLVVESFTAGVTRAYRSLDFPRSWEAVSDLLDDAQRVDPTVFEHAGRWWLLTGRWETGWTVLDLHRADHPLGPYRPHPASPIVTGDRRIARPGGRIVRHDGRLYRLAQDCSRTYGERVWAVQILHLDDERYEELPMLHQPVVCGSGRGWNRGHMHHVDAHPQADGSWLAAVDGW
jgi:hypothetical protein